MSEGAEKNFDSASTSPPSENPNALLGGTGTEERVREIGPRRVLEHALDTLWYRGGVEDDTLLMFPINLRADDSLVYVFDHGVKRVVAFEAATGYPRWSFGRRGSGPGEFGDGVLMVPGPVGGLRIWDRANSRFMDVASDGQLQGEFPLHPYTSISGLCALAGGTTLIAAVANKPPGVLRLGPPGTDPQHIRLPWTDLDTISHLAQQARMAPTGGGQECIFAFSMGRGFTRIGPGGASYAARYVEHFELPQVVTEPFGGGIRTRFARAPVRAISTPSVDSDTLVVLFSGPRGEYHDRFVDHYDAGTGTYVYSLLLDTPQVSVVRANGIYFLLDTERGDYPSLMAVRPVQ